MGRTTEVALQILLNAAWQIAFIVIGASICARVLRNAAPRYRHALWVATLMLSLALPLWALRNIQRDTPLSIVEQPVVALPARENLTSTSSPSSLPNRTVNPEEKRSPHEALLETLKRPVVTSKSVALALALAYALFLIYRMSLLSRAWLRAQRFRRSAYSRELTPLLASVSARCEALLGLKNIPLLFSASAATPATVGAWKPVIILPESLYASASEETLTTMIGHEMAHIARRDYSLNLFYEFLFLPVSFHPLTAMVRRQIGRTRELACDEMVTERLLEPRAYARSLVRVAGALLLPTGQPLTLGVFDADILEERIMKLTQHPRRLGTRAGRLLTVCAFSLLCMTGIAVSSFSLNLRTDIGNEPALLRAINPLITETAGEQQSPGQAAEAAENSTRTSESRAQLAQGLKSSNAQLRAEAACMAGKTHALEAIPELVAMLGDDSRTQSIKCWDEGRWNPALDSFKHPSPGEQAAIALASMGAAAFEPLTNALGDSNPSVRRNAAWALVS